MSFWAQISSALGTQSCEHLLRKDWGLGAGDVEPGVASQPLPFKTTPCAARSSKGPEFHYIS